MRTSSFDAQKKFAGRLAKQKKITAKQLPLQREIDVAISDEMSMWLQDTMGGVDMDEELPEEVSSVLAKPLDSMSLFTPLGAIATSQYAAARPLESINEKDDRERKERRDRAMGKSSSLSSPTRNIFPNTNNNNNDGNGISSPSYAEDDRIDFEEYSMAESTHSDTFASGMNTTNQSVASAGTLATTFSIQVSLEEGVIEKL